MLQTSLTYAKKITSFINLGQSREAIILFHQVHKVGSKITEFLLSAVARASARVAGITEGKQVHCMILKHGFDRDTVLMTSLVDMYSNCGGIDEARRVFDEMPERDVVATNSMIFGLCRFRSTLEAIELFNGMSQRDVGSWNSLISGLAKNSEGAMALCCFERMRLEGYEVDVMTMVSVVSVCADIAAVINGKRVHGLVIRYGFESYLPVQNAILDMYAKCGCMEESSKCFKTMSIKNVVSWTSLIAGYGKNGLGLQAIKAFDEMEMEGFIPNKITFLGLLYACCHGGLVQEGWRSFNTMVHKYCLTPMMEHYTCMVDLLARAGDLNDAWGFIERMPMKPDSRLLTAFLSSCCFQKNVELARSVAERLLELEPQEAGAYMLLSNFYGIVGDLKGVANVRRLMLSRGIRKQKACTWIEINREIHCFESGDKSHPLSRNINKCLQNLVEKVKDIGYVPNTSIVMQNVDEHIKKEIVLGHSEKLAITFGIISKPAGTQIMIIKNLRVCSDCHEFTRLISKIEKREIIARDSSRFHHFKDGVCSCGDHW
ncbi:hypothetical protein SLE2022_240930 [Rubroshorea leprosula]